MYRIDDATAATSIPTPEAAGTEGYFTEGNPATGTPATRVRGSWMNMIQEELRAFVVAGGLTPSKTVYTQLRDAALALFAKINGDATKTFSVAPATQSQHAVQLAQVGHGQCRLSVASATSLVLKPYNGNNLIINSVPQQVPSAGVAVSNSGLAASTVYYVYAAMNSGSVVLNLSTATHSTASNGIETKSGDAAQTLVGMIATNASAQFQANGGTAIGILNWFNRASVGAKSTQASFNFTTTGALAEINAAMRVSFLNWTDEIVNYQVSGSYSLSGAGGITAAAFVDGALGSVASSTSTFTAASQTYNYSSGGWGLQTEGVFHFASPSAFVSSGTGTSTVQMAVTTRG